MNYDTLNFDNFLILFWLASFSPDAGQRLRNSCIVDEYLRRLEQ